MDPELVAIIAELLGVDPNDPEALQTALSSLTGASMYPEENQALSGRMGMANQLRQTPMPEMRQAGRAMVAANPLEMGAAAIQRYRGEQQMTDAVKQQRSLLDALRGGRQTGMGLGMRDRAEEIWDEEKRRRGGAPYPYGDPGFPYAG